MSKMHNPPHSCEVLQEDENEKAYYFKLYTKKYEIESGIIDRKKMWHQGDPLRADSNERKLGELAAELKEIEKQLELPYHAATVETGQAADAPHAKEEEIRGDVDNIPHLQKGKNTRVKVEVWVVYQAKFMVKVGDIASTLVDRIYLEANKWGYQSDRTKEGETISKATITKMLPPKITGGRGKSKK